MAIQTEWRYGELLFLEDGRRIVASLFPTDQPDSVIVLAMYAQLDSGSLQEHAIREYQYSGKSSTSILVIAQTILDVLNDRD